MSAQLAPDYIEPIEAWKVLRCVRGPRSHLLWTWHADIEEPDAPTFVDRRPRFYSPPRGDLWPHDGPIVAKCRGARIVLITGAAIAPHTEAPEPSCTCGIYALTEGDVQLYSYANDGAAVLARVELWGKVVPGTRGYRAQYARIAAVAPTARVSSDLVEEAAELYGAELLELPEWFQDAHRPDGASQRGDVQCPALAARSGVHGAAAASARVAEAPAACEAEAAPEVGCRACCASVGEASLTYVPTFDLLAAGVYARTRPAGR